MSEVMFAQKRAVTAWSEISPAALRQSGLGKVGPTRSRRIQPQHTRMGGERKLTIASINAQTGSTCHSRLQALTATPRNESGRCVVICLRTGCEAVHLGQGTKRTGCKPVLLSRQRPALRVPALCQRASQRQTSRRASRYRWLCHCRQPRSDHCRRWRALTQSAPAARRWA